MIAPFWCRGLILWFSVPQCGHMECFQAYEDGYCCPVKFEVL